MGKSFRRRLRRTVRSWLIRVAARGLGFIPLPIARGLGGVWGHIAWFLSSRNRRLTLEHLSIAFPDLPESERRRIGRASFVHIGEGTAETVCYRQIDPILEDYVELSPRNLESIQRALAHRHGLVFATGHMGHWELLARRFAIASVPPVVVAKRSWDRKIDSVVEAFRNKLGVTTLWRDDPGSARILLNAMREGRPLGILIDQDTKVKGVFVPFFGRPAFTPRAAADLALRFHAPLFVGWTRRRPNRRGYVLELELVPYDAAADREQEVVRVTAACTARLEQVVRENPTDWVWMHRRWKTQPPESKPGPEIHPDSDEQRRGSGSLLSLPG